MVHREQLVSPFPAKDFHVLHGCRVGGEEKRDGPRRRATERSRESQDGQGAEQPARVDFEIRFHRR